MKENQTGKIPLLRVSGSFSTSVLWSDIIGKRRQLIVKPGNKGHAIRCGKRKVNAQYGFKIVTYTEGNKMGTGNVLSLCG